MPPPPVPNLQTHSSVISSANWPRRSSSSKLTSGRRPSYDNLNSSPVVVPKFVSDPNTPIKPGYQEAHKIYDEMRQFFAKKAMTVHGGKVVIIKVTMMALKEGNRHPSVVSVRETNFLSHLVTSPPFNRTYWRRFPIYLSILLFSNSSSSLIIPFFLSLWNGLRTLSWHLKTFNCVLRIGLNSCLQVLVLRMLARLHPNFLYQKEKWRYCSSNLTKCWICTWS